MKVDYLIVGAGFTGSVLAERIASILGKKVLLVEKRNHIAGNAYDYYDHSGVLIHKYGPHIFHTNSKKVWRYLSGFTKWRPYYHKTLAVVEGNHIPIPFNLNSIYECFPGKYAEKMEQALINEYGYGKKIPILKLRENGNKELAFLADYIYKHVFLGYTQKQWDLTPEELDASVTARVPVSITRDNRYFNDTYQAMPAYGYTAMFKNILDHKNIRVLLNTDYKEIIEQITFNRLIYTGPIDSYFDNTHGKLPYRSLRFELKNFEQKISQPAGIVTYPNEYNYTRISEFKYLTGQINHSTTVAYEYPQVHVSGKTEPYYPIPREQNRIIYNRYQKEALSLNGSVIFVGRLADYTYYNMDQVTARALSVFKNHIQSEQIDHIKPSLI